MAFDPESWKSAERLVYEKILTATASVDKRNAFLGFLPPAPNVWMFKTGGGDDVRNTWDLQPRELHMNAELAGQFTERTAAQAWAMKAISALPIKEGIVQCFRLRLGGLPNPVPEVVPIGNENQQAFLWVITLGCEIVFNTDGRALGT
jgi:hypothetical protein